MAILTQNSIGAVGIWLGLLPISAFAKRLQPEGSLNPSRHNMDDNGTPASRRTRPWNNRSHRRALEYE